MEREGERGVGGREGRLGENKERGETLRGDGNRGREGERRERGGGRWGRWGSGERGGGGR